MDDKMREKRLYEVIIFSSHNSYLSNYQNFDYADIKNVEFLVELGVRCLEFDVYYVDGVLKVGHGTKNIKYDLITTNLIKLEDIFKLIREKAFRDFSDMPLIINLELLTKGNLEAHRKIADKIKKYFYGYILHSKFENAKMNMGWVKLKHLRKKIIFITGNKLADGDELAKYINAYTYKMNEVKNGIYSKYILNLSNKEFYENHEIIKKHINNHGLVRIYPSGGILHHFSGNYDFGEIINSGVQIPSINIQQMGTKAINYIGVFEEKGRCIY